MTLYNNQQTTAKELVDGVSTLLGNSNYHSWITEVEEAYRKHSFYHHLIKPAVVPAPLPLDATETEIQAARIASRSLDRDRAIALTGLFLAVDSKNRLIIDDLECPHLAWKALDQCLNFKTMRAATKALDELLSLTLEDGGDPASHAVKLRALATKAGQQLREPIEDSFLCTVYILSIKGPSFQSLVDMLCMKDTPPTSAEVLRQLSLRRC